MYTYNSISPPSCVSLPPSLSHPSRWSQSTELISLCYAAAPHYLSILHLVVKHAFISIPSLTPAFQFSSLWICYQSAHLTLFSFTTIILMTLNLVLNSYWALIQCTSLALSVSYVFFHSHYNPMKQALLLPPFLKMRKLRPREVK